MMSTQSLVVMLIIMILIPTTYTFLFLLKCPMNPLYLLRRRVPPPPAGEDSASESSPAGRSKGPTGDSNDDDNDNDNKDNKYIEMVVAKGSKLGKDTECPICLSAFKEGEQLKILKVCSHMFHQSCIDTWLGAHFNCPVCRAFVSHHHARRSKMERDHQRAVRVAAARDARDDLWQGLPGASGLV